MSAVCVVDVRDPETLNPETPLLRSQFDQSAVNCLFSTLDERVSCAFLFEKESSDVSYKLIDVSFLNT